MPRKETDKLASIEERIKQLTKQKEEIEKKQKERNDKARTNRLCRRMGLLESMLPETITLTDEQFKTLLDRTIASPYGRKRLAEIQPPKVEEPSEETDETTPPNGEPSPSKPTREALSNDNAAAEKSADATEQSSATVGNNSAESTRDAG